MGGEGALVKVKVGFRVFASSTDIDVNGKSVLGSYARPLVTLAFLHQHQSWLVVT